MFGIMATLNGHVMEVQFWMGMGEGLENIVLWCHTCDPIGADLTIVDTELIDPKEGLRMLGDAAKIHSQLEVTDA